MSDERVNGETSQPRVPPPPPTHVTSASTTTTSQPEVSASRATAHGEQPDQCSPLRHLTTFGLHVTPGPVFAVVIG